MQSPDSDLSSDGGVKLTPQDEGSETNSETRSETKSVTKSETKSNKMMSALVPYIPGTMPVPATFAVSNNIYGRPSNPHRLPYANGLYRRSARLARRL